MGLSMSKSGPYEDLGLEKGATLEEILTKYRDLLFTLPSDDPETLEKIHKLLDAYSILTREDQRRIYDAYGSLGLYVGRLISGEDVPMSTWWFKGVMACLGFTCGCCNCPCHCPCFNWSCHRPCCGLGVPGPEEKQGTDFTQGFPTPPPCRPPAGAAPNPPTPPQTNEVIEATIHTQTSKV